MLKNNSFVALVKREVIENKNSFIKVPVILLGIALLMVLATVFGFTNNGLYSEFGDNNVNNMGELLTLASHEVGSPDQFNKFITLGYWTFSSVPMMVLPFIVFFSLLGSLYEERRDRTILFWKSMPVSDWQEVMAKLVATVIVAPILVFGIMIAGQLITAVIFSITSLVQGGPVSVLWPLGTMIGLWLNGLITYLIYALWVSPIFAWLLIASAYSPRMPFMFAVLPPALVMLIQGVFFSSSSFAEWFGLRISGAGMVDGMHINLNGGDELIQILDFSLIGSMIMNVLSSGQFWFGLVVAGGFLFGAVELRKRAV